MGRAACGRDAGRPPGRADRRHGRRPAADHIARRLGRVWALPGRRPRDSRTCRSRGGGPMIARLLAIDTSGTNALVALGGADGSLFAERHWQAGYRHGEELLARVDEMLTTAGMTVSDLSGVIVGTGPGAFTGLRVGLATAKALARGLDIPIAGIATSDALLSGTPVSAGMQAVLLLPAGPSDRVLVVAGTAVLIK